MSLATAPIEKRMRVISIRGADSIAARMMEMGMIEGAEVSIVRRAPLGDPLQVRLGDYDLSIRSLDAARIDVIPA